MERLPVEHDDDELISVGQPIPDVVRVNVAGPLCLSVQFDDGVRGLVEFKQSALRGAFGKLADAEYFNQVGIAAGAVSWPNEDPDMAPDVMHDSIIAGNGKWIVI